MRMVTTIIAVIVAASVFSLVHTGQASATVRHVNGRCGIHRGLRVIPYLHRYHARIGVRNGTTGGSHRCYGKYVPKGSRAANVPNCCSFSWKTFDFTTWNWHGIIDVTGATTLTTISCAGFAAAFAGEFPTGGLDTAGTAAAGAGCVGGATLLQHTINSDFYAKR